MAAATNANNENNNNANGSAKLTGSADCAGRSRLAEPRRAAPSQAELADCVAAAARENKAQDWPGRQCELLAQRPAPACADRSRLAGWRAAEAHTGRQRRSASRARVESHSWPSGPSRELAAPNRSRPTAASYRASLCGREQRLAKLSASLAFPRLAAAAALDAHWPSGRGRRPTPTPILTPTLTRPLVTQSRGLRERAPRSSFRLARSRPASRGDFFNCKSKTLAARRLFSPSAGPLAARYAR